MISAIVVIVAGVGAYIWISARAPVPENRFPQAVAIPGPAIDRADPMDAAPPLITGKLILPELPEQTVERQLPYAAVPPELVHESAPVREPSAASPAPAPDNGPPAWRRNAVVFEPGDKPLVAIIIDDAGVDRRRTKKVIALPGPMTIAFLPYARGLAEQTAAARAAGHELLVHVSMEPGNPKIDPGPRVLKAGAEAAAILENLNWGLAQFEGFVGINNHMGSKFTSHAPSMSVVMSELASRGLLFVDSRTSRSTVGAKLARSLSVPVAERNVFLDHEPKPEVIAKQLKQLERIAKKQGYAIAIGHPKDATIAALEEWLPSAAERGLALSPVSAVVDLTIQLAANRTAR